jgi:TPR repeat protein
MFLALLSSVKEEPEWHSSLFYGDYYYTNQDYSSALHWYSFAASMGSPTACTVIGGLYTFGLGVNKDYTTGLEWYSKAVLRGCPIAQTYMGLEMVKQNRFKEAVHLYGLAACQGYAQAYYCLGVLYTKLNKNETNPWISVYNERKIFEYFGLAAKQGYSKAVLEVAKCFEFGIGTKVDVQQARYFFKVVK